MIPVNPIASQGESILSNHLRIEGSWSNKVRMAPFIKPPR